MAERGACGSLGYLTVAGRIVGLLRCTAPRGHDLPRIGPAWVGQAMGVHPGTPHRSTLEWGDDEAVDWPEALDPATVFDVAAPSDDG